VGAGVAGGQADDKNRKPPPSLGNKERESVMMDSKRAMREDNLAWGCHYHWQMRFAGVLLETWPDNLTEV
jgi:hypothetical protein